MKCLQNKWTQKVTRNFIIEYIDRRMAIWIIAALGTIAAIASLIGLVRNWAEAKQARIHALYRCFIVLLSLVSASTIASKKHVENEAANRIRELTAIEKQAQQVLKDGIGISDGARQGFMFAALGVIENHQGRRPDTYERAKQYCESAGVFNKRSGSYTEHSFKIKDGEDALERLLKALSSSGLSSEKE